MSGNSNYYPNGDPRGARRYDSYYDKSVDPRDNRGRGGFRGNRGHDHYSHSPRGRGRNFGRPDRNYGSHRDVRDGSRPSYHESHYRGDFEDSARDSPRDSPRDSNHRDHVSRENVQRDSPRDSRREESREFSRNSNYTRNEHSEEYRGPRNEPVVGNKDGSLRAEERQERAERTSDWPSERPERPSVRGTPRNSIYGHKRSSEVGQGFRGSGNNTPVGAVVEGAAAANSAQKKSSAYTNPWISLLRLGEGKTAGRLEQNYKELASINDKLADLQSEKIRLTMALSTLEVYAKRDALNVEICTEKLDEFTYL